MNHDRDSMGREGITAKERRTIRWATGLGILAVLGFLIWYFDLLQSAPLVYSMVL